MDSWNVVKKVFSDCKSNIDTNKKQSSVTAKRKREKNSLKENERRRQQQSCNYKYPKLNVSINSLQNYDDSPSLMKLCSGNLEDYNITPTNFFTSKQQLFSNETSLSPLKPKNKILSKSNTSLKNNLNRCQTTDLLIIDNDSDDNKKCQRSIGEIFGGSSNGDKEENLLPNIDDNESPSKEYYTKSQCNSPCENLFIEENSEEINGEIQKSNVHKDYHGSCLSATKDFLITQESSENSAIDNIDYKSSLSCSNDKIQIEFSSSSSLTTAFNGNKESELDILIYEIQKDLKKTKKIKFRPIKGGYVEKFRKILKSNCSEKIFWKNELNNGFNAFNVLYEILSTEVFFKIKIITIKSADSKIRKVLINLNKSDLDLNIGEKVIINYDREIIQLKNVEYLFGPNKIIKKCFYCFLLHSYS